MPTPQQRPWLDQVDQAGRNIADRAQELVEQGQTRRIVLRDGKGKTVVQLPLLVGLVVATVLTVSAPWLVVIAGLIGVVAGFRLRVIPRTPRPELPKHDA